MNENLMCALADRYRIEREIGAGGMATVYLARDIRHDRPVALKLLKPELGALLGVERFLAEIKVTANLQHPNLLPLFDSGGVDGMLFYVMPYVEGESLRVKLEREKQLPVDEAVHLAVAIANALDYAHRHGVIHRDLKPENILLQAGEPMVADFGIALAVSNAGGNRITQTGLSLGTPQYMSPEQATGDRVIDGRSDIYSLAALTYEMLTGEPPHTGSTAQAIIARVLTERPRSVRSARPAVPEQVDWALERALAKLPADRWSTAREFSETIQGRGTSGMAMHATGTWNTGAGVAATTRRRDWLTRLALPMAGLAISAVGVAAWALTRPVPIPPPAHYPLYFADSRAPVPDRTFAVSPDGLYLAYVGPAPSGLQLWIKARDRDMAVPLAGTTSTYAFTFSPDSRWIAFVAANHQLKKISVQGGAAVTLADSVNNGASFAWLDNGAIVYAEQSDRELRQIPDGGGTPAAILQSDSVAMWGVVGLPGSYGVLYERCSRLRCDRETWALDLTSRRSHRIIAGDVTAAYVPTGFIVYVRPDGAMFAQPFDPKSLATRGTAVPIRDSVSLAVTGYAQFAVSAEGTLFLRSGAAAAASALYGLVWVDRAGREVPIDSSWTFHLPVYGGNAGWALSPDGNRVAIGINTEAGDQIWVKQLGRDPAARGPLSRVSFDSAKNVRPRWIANGKSIMYISSRGAVATLFQRRADGTGTDEPVLPALHVAPPGIFEAAFSPDGKWLLLRMGGTVNVAGGRDITGMHVGVDTAPRPLVASPAYDENSIALSPDGRWLAYESTETGRSEVFIRPFPNTDAAKWQVSVNGGRAPLWARNGRELFFVDGSRDMVVSTIGVGATPDPAPPARLFHMRDELYLAAQENYTPFDISPDGQRFLMARRVQAIGALVPPLVVIENWFDELRRATAKH